MNLRSFTTLAILAIATSKADITKGVSDLVEQGSQAE